MDRAVLTLKSQARKLEQQRARVGAGCWAGGAPGRGMGCGCCLALQAAAFLRQNEMCTYHQALHASLLYRRSKGTLTGSDR